MIALLTGQIAYAGADDAVVDVGGVGYHVFVAANDARDMMAAPRGATITLHIETHVREDHIHLYGFTTALAKAWFRRLTGVSGVGAKTALSILSTCPPEQLVGIMAAGDHKALARADGVGPKLAQRLVIELRDKSAPIPAAVTSAPIGAKTGAGPTSMAEDAVAALVGLGYDRTAAHAAVHGVIGGAVGGAPPLLADVIRGALRILAG